MHEKWDQTTLPDFYSKKCGQLTADPVFPTFRGPWSL